MIENAPTRFRGAWGAGQTPARTMRKKKPRNVANPRPVQRFGGKPIARFAGGRMPVRRVVMPQLESPGLGFSLKPPKKLRKAFKAVKKAVTIKNVLKVGAVVGAAALIPGALPMLAKGAVGGAKLLARGARGVGRGAVGAERLVARGVRAVISPLTGGKNNPGGGAELVDLLPADLKPTGDPLPVVAPTAPLPPSALPAPDPVAVAPSGGGYSSGGGGGESKNSPAEESAATGAPDQAGVGGASPILVLGGLALLAGVLSRPRRRVRRSA